MTDPTPAGWRRGLRSVLPTLRVTALLAVLCNLALEAVRLTSVGDYPWRHKTPAFVPLFLLGTVVLWLLVGLVHAVVGRLWVTTTLAATATAVVAVADHEKVLLRREPLYPGDWRFAGDLAFLRDMLGTRFVLLLTAGVLLAAVGALAGARAARARPTRRHRREQPPAAPRGRTLLRLLAAGLCLLGLGHLADFNSPGNAARGAYEALGATWKPWSQQRNYLGNGFVGGFLYNLDIPEVPEPAGYSARRMAGIAATYTRAAERINRARDLGGLHDVNVVMVLSESFSDPLELRGVRVPTDPIPFTRRLMSTTTSGRMLATGIGGGTANMEFEALTGMSLSQLPPQIGTPYHALVPEYDRFPSAVRWFKRHGHRAVAIHPFTTEMYRRRDVYRSLGFDDFIYDERMRDRRRVGRDGYISDEAAFGELQRLIAAEPDPLFVNLVTMQNHAPYTGLYDDPVPVTGPGGEALTEVGQYVRGLTHTDRALRRLVVHLRRSGERTVLVLYGDHLPGSYPAAVFDANGTRAMHQTPFLVWANVPGPSRVQPTTSPVHFVDLVLERAGVAVPPYYALLQQLRREVPAMDLGMLIDDQGRRVPPGRLPERARRLLRDYRLVQYDLSVGERYSARAMFGCAPRPHVTPRTARTAGPSSPPYPRPRRSCAPLPRPTAR